MGRIWDTVGRGPRWRKGRRVADPMLPTSMFPGLAATRAERRGTLRAVLQSARNVVPPGGRYSSETTPSFSTS